LPIPFHDAEDLEELGAAAFLHVDQLRPHSPERFGALLFINARGEPLEFAYNRVELLSNTLWRPLDRGQAAVRRLALSLFRECSLTPVLLFCRADVVDPHLFGTTGQLMLEVPVGRIATATEAVGYIGSERLATIDTADSSGEIRETHLFWIPDPPEGAAALLFNRLSERGLLLEPFERAAMGLREVYAELLHGR